ncbi:uncharacterized protein At2g34460, chloroplastic isoform X2 [Phragmites australis]|uniref:uncharacterized protein At2g34460, chloroplastic isoform X2 n=1 Tax=Phragmites australis TaxID=29695 RepID=UPI002D779BC2|nr:uncharacterized protein At2g34460, chloroplastic isoform X2 [Phragmites australis]
MASAVCGVAARPHLALALPTTTRKLFFRCSVASSMDAASASSPDAEKKTTTVFVAGSTGRTGKRVVEKLLARGLGVVAGTTDVGRARGSLPQDPNLQLVRADVTEGVDKLAEAMHGVDAVVCATGFRRSFDLFAPWKVDNFGTVNLVEACRKAGVTRFVLVSSILVNGAAMGRETHQEIRNKLHHCKAWRADRSTTNREYCHGARGHPLHGIHIEGPSCGSGCGSIVVPRGVLQSR